ncbi:MAG: antitermination protein NusB [Eggerthellaceae bacterium]|nr:antitermination protein NusB [Eggerthellaceae bacterium]
MSKLSPARRMALKVNCEVRHREAFASELLDTELEQYDRPMKAEDRAFARVLVLGVTATLGTLDELINRCLRSPSDIKDDVRDALRISAYELIFLHKAPHAAVDQGVELVKHVAPHAGGLANAVLRKIATATKTFPFGDPDTNDEALARLYGFPLWMARLLVQTMGRVNASDFMRISNQPAPVFAAVNSLKSDDDRVSRAFIEEASHCKDAEQLGDKKPVERMRLAPKLAPLPGCLLLNDATLIISPTAHKLFERGSLLVSDCSAQAIALLAIPHDYPQHGFLEIGAGRGTKTILMQSGANRRFKRQMPLTACDVHGFKKHLLEDRAHCYGVNIDHVICGDAREANTFDSKRMYSAAFIDAPCSGIGTLRRHPELRWRLKEEDITSMAQNGYTMLMSVAPHIEVGGQLTYATCTVTHEENELVIKRFLSTPEGRRFRIVPTSLTPKDPLFFKTLLTERGCDAHFAACLRCVE